MWRYLRAAFLVGVDVPGVGRLPVNAMATAAFGILGFAEPSLWLLGLGLESSILFALTTNRRFQKVVDAQQLQSTEQDADSKRRALISTLSPELQQRLLDLTRTCRKVEEVSQQSDDFVLDTNRDALQRLEWVYLKLLVARNTLTLAGAKESYRDLAHKIGELESDLTVPGTSESLRQSKAATLAILKERIGNVGRRKETLDEIDSDLARIEAQVELILENASMQGKPSTISTDIELACNLAGSNLYGDSGRAIADLDQTFGRADSATAVAKPRTGENE